MKPARIIAVGAVSALGRGDAAFDPGSRHGITDDAALAGVGLRKPRLARAIDAADAGVDPAQVLVARALDDLCAELDENVPGWRRRRVLVVIGTSSGGMWSQTRAFDAQHASPLSGEGARALCRAAPYWGPLELLRGRLPGVPIIQVLAACASSAMAIGFGCRLLDAGDADLVLAGGYDAVTPFVAAGFEALGATSPSQPSPFSLQRDGLVLGEGAALVALTHSSAAGRYVLGFGATSDAAHPTAPAADGAQLARAAQLALEDAGGAPGPMLISAHGTATLSNDRAEASAIRLIAEARPGAGLLGVHAFKARLGHSLGAGSALELLAGLRCIELGQIPSLEGAPHEALPARGASHGGAGLVLKLASAFGGSNAALVSSWLSEGEASTDQVAAVRFGVRVSCVGHAHSAPDLERVAEHTQVARVHVLRLDMLTALAATAALDVVLDAGAPSAAVSDVAGKRIAVVMGSVAATMEHNADYQARLRARGHAAADPRRFPATSPNLAPGMLSILFKLSGPNLTVGAGGAAPFEALLLGLELVACGDVEEALVVAGDCVGAAVSGIFQGAGYAQPTHGVVALRLTRVAAETKRPLKGLLDQAERADILARIAAARTVTHNSLPPRIGNLSTAAPGEAPEPASLSPGAGWPQLTTWLRTRDLC